MRGRAKKEFLDSIFEVSQSRVVRPSTSSKMHSVIEHTKAETLSAKVDDLKQEIISIQMSKHEIKNEWNSHQQKKWMKECSEKLGNAWISKEKLMKHRLVSTLSTGQHNIDTEMVLYV